MHEELQVLIMWSFPILSIPQALHERSTVLKKMLLAALYTCVFDHWLREACSLLMKK